MSPSQVRLCATGGTFALALGLLTACGGSAEAGGAPSSSSTSSSSATSSSSSSDGSTQAQTLSVTEVGFDIKLENTDLTAGDYTVTLTNDGDATHDLVVEQNGSDIAKSDAVGPGKSTTFTVSLKTGDYVFYCSIGNHRAMGMETDVTVN